MPKLHETFALTPLVLLIYININPFVKALSDTSSNYPFPSRAVGQSCTEPGAAPKSPEWRWEGRFFLFEAGIVEVPVTGGWTALFDCDTGPPDPSPGPARGEQGEEKTPVQTLWFQTGFAFAASFPRLRGAKGCFQMPCLGTVTGNWQPHTSTYPRKAEAHHL